MGFMDKAREAAGQAAARAEQAATEAREKVGDVQAKRDLAAAYGDLGRTAYSLAHSGAISHPQLEAQVARITQLEASGGGSDQPAAPAAPVS